MVESLECNVSCTFLEKPAINTELIGAFLLFGVNFLVVEFWEFGIMNLILG